MKAIQIIGVPTLQNFARITLACVFVLTGVAKTLSPSQAIFFSTEIFHFAPTLGRYIVIALSVTEIVVGLLLLFANSQLLPYLSFCVGMLLFGFVIVGIHAQGSEVSCGCFGEILDSKPNEIFLARNVALLMLSMVLMKVPARANQERREIE